MFLTGRSRKIEENTPNALNEVFGPTNKLKEHDRKLKDS